MSCAARWKMSLVPSAWALKARTAPALPMAGGATFIAGTRLASPGALCASRAWLKSPKDILCLRMQPPHSAPCWLISHLTLNDAWHPDKAMRCGARPDARQAAQHAEGGCSRQAYTRFMHKLILWPLH